MFQITLKSKLFILLANDAMKITVSECTDYQSWKLKMDRNNLSGRRGGCTGGDIQGRGRDEAEQEQ